MFSRSSATALIVLALITSACQTVVESGDDTALTPLGTPSVSIVAATTTILATTTTSTTTTPPLATTTTSVPATTTPPETTTTAPPETTTTTSTPTTTSTTTTTTTTTTTIPATTTTSTTTPASTTTTTEPFYSDEPSSGTLSEGDRGDRTTAMQAQLVALGYLNPGADDGLFGEVTTAAVKKFQEDSDLDVDGLVGPNTSAALAAAIDEL